VSKLPKRSYCTSLQCNAKMDIKTYCADCSHARWYGIAQDGHLGPIYQWHFNPMFGPEFFNKRGTGYRRCCGPRHAVWALFERWYNRKFGKVKHNDNCRLAGRGGE
jgi:hypothetical protein